MSFLSSIETMQASTAAQALIAIEAIYGVDALTYRPTKTVEEDVYGVSGTINRGNAVTRKQKSNPDY